jgi:hypothetical protein
MGRRVFFSFHFVNDAVRASQVRNMGVVEGDPPVSDNDWEEIVKGGDAAIQKWIDGQISGKSCTIVLIGSATADRKWIDYEIKKSWDAGKGLVGIYIHNLKDFSGATSNKGTNPFAGFTLKNGTVRLDNFVKLYDPPGWQSTDVYKAIKGNIEGLVEGAITLRESYG